MARPRHRVGNLPAEATSFIGRRQELAEIRKKLAIARLVSLVGPGGVGKTRLGLQIASDLGRGFPDGAWLVELAEVRDGELVTNAVLEALDLRDQSATKPLEILLSNLQNRQLLLLVDNCEHLLGAVAPLVMQILGAAPRLTVITTTREPLQVPGEHVVPIPPLHLPAENGTEPLAHLRQNEAVMLFSERAAAASGTFELTGSNQAAVVALCRRLDGLPLAIELAAVRTRALSVGQILERLTDRFALLTAGGRAALPRHQTLRTTIDWSYELLTPAEQILLRRLCVFAARFSLEDVEAVCTTDDVPASRAFDELSSLVDKSLVIKDEVGGLACYRLHETMREYAQIKLREADEVEVLEDRCVEYYRTLCLRSADRARYRLLEWLPWAELEIDNIRAVLQHCLVRGDSIRGLDIAAAMKYYWITHGTAESVRWLDQLLELGGASSRTQMRAFYLRGWLSMLKGDPAGARPFIGRAIAAARENGEPALLSESLSIAATVEDVAGAPEAASRYLDEAEAITAGLDDFPARIELLQAQAIHAVFRRDLETVRAASVEGVRLSREAGDLYQLEAFLRNLGMVGIMSGDFHSGNAQNMEALRVARNFDNRLAQYYGLTAAALYAANTGRKRAAAQLFGAAAALGMQTGADIMGPLVPLLVLAKESSKEALGSPKFEAEFQAGTRLTRIAALRLALGESDQAEVAPSKGAPSAALGKRELEVARLVAEGLSNKQIGARLLVSDATVATHIRSIMNKLGFNSRTQIAIWIASSN